MEHSEAINLREGTLIQYWRNGWHAAYFERIEPPKRPKVAILIPPIIGKRRIEVPLSDVRMIQP